MNERIRELAFQAMSINQKVSDDAFFVEVSKLKEFEKFAELIVKECGEVAYKAYWDDPEAVRGIHIQEQIKRHFGIEELSK